MPPLDFQKSFGVPVAALGLALTSGCTGRAIGDGDGGGGGVAGDITDDWKAIKISYSYDGRTYGYDLPYKDSYYGCTYKWGIYLSIEDDYTGVLTNSYSSDCPGTEYDYDYDEETPVFVSPIPDTNDFEMVIANADVITCTVGSSKMTCGDSNGEITFKRR